MPMLRLIDYKLTQVPSQSRVVQRKNSIDLTDLLEPIQKIEQSEHFERSIWSQLIDGVEIPNETYTSATKESRNKNALKIFLSPIFYVRQYATHLPKISKNNFQIMKNALKACNLGCELASKKLLKRVERVDHILHFK